MNASFRSRMAGLLLLCGLTLLMIGNLRRIRSHWHTLRESGAHAGRPAPDFRLPLLTGGNVSLGEAHGHVLVLSFWATWCEPCQKELPGVERLYQRLRPLGVQFVAVNVEGPRARVAVLKNVKGLGLTMPVALDEGSVADLYGVDSIPQTVVIDGDGEVGSVYRGLYDEREIERAIRSSVK